MLILSLSRAFHRLITGFFCMIAFPIIAFDVAKFQELINQPTPAWMIKQIQSDLAPFQPMISSELLESCWSASYPKGVRIKVINGSVSVLSQDYHQKEYNTICKEYVNCIENLNALVKLPDLDLIIFLGDRIFKEEHRSYPIFSMAKSKSDRGLILIPDMKAIEGYNPSRNLILDGIPHYPWNTKINQMYWRGTPTGIRNQANWQIYLRPQLVLLSLQHPELDAKMTKRTEKEFVNRFNNNIYTALTGMGLMDERVAEVDHLKYKYLIDVDGNTCTWPRCYWILLSNSVMFKHVSEEIQWFYRGIKPYKHYIPIAFDYSDLMEQFTWAVNHDEECERIAKNATFFAEESLCHEAVYLYVYRLLESYAKLTSCGS